MGILLGDEGDGLARLASTTSTTNPARREREGSTHAPHIRYNIIQRLEDSVQASTGVARGEGGATRAPSGPPPRPPPTPG